MFWDGTSWVPDVPATTALRPRRTRRILGAATEAGIITLLIFGLIAGTTLAAKGGNSGGGKGKPGASASMALVLLDSTDAVANHGERITFTVATTATDRPFVWLNCYQDGAGVFGSSIGLFPSFMFDPWFTLDSSYWTAGVEANCVARAYFYDKRGNQKDLASMPFNVAP
jgi:hypothetical protein